MTVPSRDISVLIHGPVDDFQRTIKSLESIEKLLPESEIIVSTYEDCRDICANLSATYPEVKWVFSEDPGGMPSKSQHATSNNINRILVTVQAGLESATRDYLLKIRSDLTLTGAGFLRYWEALGDRDVHFALFSRKLITVSTYSKLNYFDFRNLTSMPACFHVSDWCHFGTAEDMRIFFGQPLVDVEEEAFFLDSVSWGDRAKRIYEDLFSFKYPPEVGLFIGALRTRFTIEYSHFQDRNDIMFPSAERYLLSNFMVIDPHQFGVDSLKPAHYHAVNNPYAHLDIAINGYTHRSYSKAHRSQFGTNLPFIDRRSTIAELLTRPAIVLKLATIRWLKSPFLSRLFWTLADKYGLLILRLVGIR